LNLANIDGGYIFKMGERKIVIQLWKPDVKTI